MNIKRRAELRDVVSMLSRAVLIVDKICDKEQDAIENYPENLQATEKFEAMENAVESLNDAIEKIDEAKEHIETAIR
jgi:thymidine phosphorylase